MGAVHMGGLDGGAPLRDNPNRPRIKKRDHDEMTELVDVFDHHALKKDALRNLALNIVSDGFIFGPPERGREFDEFRIRLHVLARSTKPGWKLSIMNDRKVGIRAFLLPVES